MLITRWQHVQLCNIYHSCTVFISMIYNLIHKIPIFCLSQSNIIYKSYTKSKKHKNIFTNLISFCDRFIQWFCPCIVLCYVMHKILTFNNISEKLQSHFKWIIIIAAVADNPDTVFSRRLIADQSPIGCRLISKKLQTFCNQKQTLKIQSPTSRRPIANWLPIAPHLIADWLPTDRRWVGNHCPITQQYSINTRSLSAPEPMLDLCLVSSSDINLKAISWRQFYKRYLNHWSLKLTWELLIWYLFQI